MQGLVLIVSDNFDRSSRAAGFLAREYRWDMADPEKLSGRKSSDVLALLIDIDMANLASIDALRAAARSEFAGTPKLLLVPEKRHGVMVQANALGASEVLAPPYTAEKLQAGVRSLLGAGKSIWAGRAESERLALNSATLVDRSILAAVESGRPLPKAEITRCSSLVADSLADSGIASWLDAVRFHHSYTHRHCLTVSGLAVAFAQYCGVSPEDVRRMAACSLLHDVGKAKISLSILDKPGPLSDDERAEMNRHPLYGCEILTDDGQFDATIIDMTRHHHELLDGSGYPDGLSGNQISDLVRMLTIVDIFSALIDERSYKQPLSAPEAIRVLEGMDGTVDMDILQAFKPVALADETGAGQLRRTGTE
jgi:putative nucleotidyltransferase with HDIG domain